MASRWLPLASLALTGVLAVPLASELCRAQGTGRSPRAVEVLRYGCANSLGRREVTLFGNGTIRLRDGDLGKEWMGLSELNPDELATYLGRLAEEDLSRVERPSRGLDGEWVEQCELAVELPGHRLELFHFSRYDTLPLALSRAVRVADDLAARVKDLSRRDEQLPVSYEPAAGDVLKRKDGMLFRFTRFTSEDKRMLELEGVDQPFELYVPRDQLRQVFVSLVARRR